MRDHKERGKRYCPLMKEWCTKGWTPTMGTGPDGFPIEGACASWQPVQLFAIEKQKHEDVYDCAEFGWAVDQRDAALNFAAQTHFGVDKVKEEIIKMKDSPVILQLPSEVVHDHVHNSARLIEEKNGIS